MVMQVSTTGCDRSANLGASPEETAMIKRVTGTAGISKVTFVLPVDQPGPAPVSVVGDFNAWDPFSHPLRRRSNGTRSVSIQLSPGRYRFRYLTSSGMFFDDPDADGHEANGYGETHSVLVA
jgi:1,4-alpha-glucan branching enzyme